MIDKTKEINAQYLDWMYDKVCNDRYSKKNTYRLLFEYLYEKVFYYIIPMDGNRAEDGVDLRYEFGREFNYPEAMIATYLDNRPCSVLEMMIALAIRCENNIMEDDDYGNRVGQWFWEMIVSLGLGHMNDDNFDFVFVDNTIDRFLERKYERNGEGSLFKVEDQAKDMRTIEIWYQMHAHLSEVLEG